MYHVGTQFAAVRCVFALVFTCVGLKCSCSDSGCSMTLDCCHDAEHSQAANRYSLSIVYMARCCPRYLFHVLPFGTMQTLQALGVMGCYRDSWPLLIVAPASMRLM